MELHRLLGQIVGIAIGVIIAHFTFIPFVNFIFMRFGAQ